MLSHACVGFQALGILVRSPWLPISPWQACSWVQTGQPGRIFCPYGLLPLASAVKWASSSLSFSEVPNWTMSLGTLSAQKPRTMNLRALGGNSGGAKSVVGGEGRGEFCRSECSSQALVFCSFFLLSITENETSAPLCPSLSVASDRHPPHPLTPLRGEEKQKPASHFLSTNSFF